MSKVLVTIKKRFLDGVFEEFERRKKEEPNFKYPIPDKDTIIEFRTSCMGDIDNGEGGKLYPEKTFACFDHEKNVLIVQ